MKVLSHAIFVIAMLPLAPCYAAGAPEQLKGKSIVLTWTETRQQRNVGEGDFRTVNASHRLSIYVSTQGRVFSRQTNTTRAGTGNIDQVEGEGGGAYAPRTPSFSGQTMTVISANNGGARRAVIDFDAGFTSCNAKASTGFEAGRTKISLSPITHKRIEMKSVTSGGESCSIQSGNVLGGPT